MSEENPVSPFSGLPVIEASPDKKCNKGCNGKGQVKMVRKTLPENSNIIVQGEIKVQGGDFRVLELCSCVIKNAQRIAREKGFKDQKFTVKLKDSNVL